MNVYVGLGSECPKDASEVSGEECSEGVTMECCNRRPSDVQFFGKRMDSSRFFGECYSCMYLQRPH